VRISGGEFRGRVLSVPKGLDVRPTQDRVREALFSMLQNDIRGARFLDLFAGSGSVGLEALSRGAAEVAFVEQAPRSLASLAQNIAMLKVEARCSTIRADVYAWLSAPNGLNVPNALGFDIAYADPPYAVGAEHGYATVLARLAEGGFVKPAGLFIAEMTAGQAPDSAPAWELCRDRTYGQTRLAIYRRR
jgi:16S rRNA (guanine966-N2)-methyltransferase